MNRRVSPVRPFSHVRWDELALDKVTEMTSRKIVAGAHQTLVQMWLKRGAMAARQRHDSEQMTYVLDGALRVQIASGAAAARAGHDAAMEDVTVRAGEVIVIPAGAAHQVEALDDALVLSVYSPARADLAPDLS